MPHIEVRTQLEVDDASVVDLLNRTDPDHPPLTVELYRGEYAARAPGAGLVQFVALAGGTLVGALSLEEVTWLQTPHVYFVELAVAPEWQQRGIGRRLAGVMEDMAVRLEASVLYARVQEGDTRAQQFATVRGFTPTGDVDRISRLDVTRVDLDTLSAAGTRLLDRGIRLTRLAELQPDEAFLRALHAVMDQTAIDIPSVEPFGGASFEAWRGRYVERPGMSPEWTWVALEGDRPVGVAFLRRYSDEAAGNSYTGVSREYRGRGIARGLKKQQILWAKEHGIHWIFTGNDSHNAPMLAINAALGYEFLPAKIEFGKEL